MDNAPEKMDRLIRRTEAAEYLGVAVTTLDGWVQRGILQRPIQLSVNAPSWRLSVLDAFIAQAEAKPYSPGKRRGRPAKLPKATKVFE